MVQISVWIIIGASLCAIPALSSISLYTRWENNTCPEVTFTCTALNLQSSVLRWFINGEEIAVYTFSQSHQYPLFVQPQFRIPLGDVNIKIITANLNENRISIWSTITVNISFLKIIEISTISCGLFSESMRKSANIQYNLSQVPQTPVGLSLLPLYNEESELTELLIKWNEVNSRDEYCYHAVNYVVKIEDSVTNVIEQINVQSDSCDDGICSTTIFPSSSIGNYIVHVTATNTIGSSFPATVHSITYGSVSSIVDHSLHFKNCITTAFCSTTLDEKGSCSIRYTQDVSYQDLGPPTISTLNSSFSLPPLKSDSTYFIEITFSLNSDSIILRRNFTTGIGPARFSALVLSFIFLGLPQYILCLAATIVVGIKISKGLFNRILFIALLAVTILITILWIAAFARIGTETDTCNQVWQKESNAVTITAFVMSTLATILSLVAITIVSLDHKKNKTSTISRGKETTSQVYAVSQPNSGIQLKTNAAYHVRRSSENPPHDNIYTKTSSTKTEFCSNPNKYDYVGF